MIDAGPLATFGLLLVRPGMLVLATPVFGGTFAPPQVRIGLGILLALAMRPAVPPVGAGGPIGLVVTIAGEVAVGLALSIGVRLIIAAAELAGHLIGFQLGLSYAALVDPQSGVRNNVLASLYGNMALLTFLGINGHHALIEALAGSYATLPIGAAGISGPLAPVVTDMLGLVFLTGTRLAAPVVTALLLVELALGLMSRAAPSLNLMIVGTPLRLIAGLTCLSATIYVLPGVISGSALPAAELTARLLRALE